MEKFWQGVLDSGIAGVGLKILEVFAHGSKATEVGVLNERAGRQKNSARFNSSWSAVRPTSLPDPARGRDSLPGLAPPVIAAESLANRAYSLASMRSIIDLSAEVGAERRGGGGAAGHARYQGVRRDAPRTSARCASMMHRRSWTGRSRGKLVIKQCVRGPEQCFERTTAIHTGIHIVIFALRRQGTLATGVGLRRSCHLARVVGKLKRNNSEL